MIELGLSLVKVGDRRREDYGDIDALAASIAEHGLLHPIVVDADDNLVAGGRRLRAVEQLGWLSIPVTRLGDLADKQLREIELEENLRRKDLSPIEVSRNMVALAEVAAEVAQVGPPTNARKPGSDRDVSERVGVPRATIQRAREHVAAVEEFPDLEALPQSQAIQQARVLRAPISDELLEQQQRDTMRNLLHQSLRALEGPPSMAEACARELLEHDALDPLTTDRFEKAIAFAETFISVIQKETAHAAA